MANNIYLSVVLFLVFNLSAQAQIEKSTWMLGGQASIKQSTGLGGIFSLNTALMGGYFINNRIVLGLKPELSIQVLNNFELNQFTAGVGVLGRYYMLIKPQTKTKLFLQLSPSMRYHR